jgi:hypothetical protein
MSMVVSKRVSIGLMTPIEPLIDPLLSLDVFVPITPTGLIISIICS